MLGGTPLGERRHNGAEWEGAAKKSQSSHSSGNFCAHFPSIGKCFVFSVVSFHKEKEKKMKRRGTRYLCLFVSALLICLCMPLAAQAQETEKTFTVQIEGISENLFYGTVKMTSAEAITAADLFVYMDENIEGLSIIGADAGYITKVNNDGSALTDVGWDGWMFRVNGETPAVGISDFDLTDGDSVVLYYSDEFVTGMQFPVMHAETVNEDGVISFTSFDTEYDAQWNPTVSEKPVANMKVTINGTTYHTDDEGKIVLASATLSKGGIFTVSVSRSQGGVPTVLRLAPDTTVSVLIPATYTLRIEGISECLFDETVNMMVPGQATVAELLQYADAQSDNITIVGADYGYITQVNNDGSALTDIGWDGWMYRVNGETPMLGISDYGLAEGDQVVLYYSDEYSTGMQFPVMDASGLKEDRSIRFTSMDTEYDANWNPTVVENPVAGMTVHIGNETYVTDDDGKIFLSKTQAAMGGSILPVSVSREEDGIPTVLRLPTDTTIYVPVYTNPATGDSTLIWVAGIALFALIGLSLCLINAKKAKVTK